MDYSKLPISKSWFQSSLACLGPFYIRVAPLGFAQIDFLRTGKMARSGQSGVLRNATQPQGSQRGSKDFQNLLKKHWNVKYLASEQAAPQHIINVVEKSFSSAYLERVSKALSESRSLLQTIPAMIEKPPVKLLAKRQLLAKKGSLVASSWFICSALVYACAPGLPMFLPAVSPMILHSQDPFRQRVKQCTMPAPQAAPQKVATTNALLTAQSGARQLRISCSSAPCSSHRNCMPLFRKWYPGWLRYIPLS